MNIYFIFSTLIAAMCEEIEWRGYLLTKLQLRISPLKSSVIIGVLWAFWHVPKLLMGLNYFIVCFFAIMSLSFILTYVFNRTGGNIVVVTFIHSIINLMAGFFLLGMADDLRVSLFNSIVYILWAAALIRFGKKHNNKRSFNFQ